MANQTEKKIENQMETEVIWFYIGVNIYIYTYIRSHIGVSYRA